MRASVSAISLPVLLSTLAASSAPTLAASATAAAYPDRVVRLIVPRAPGGLVDIVARVYGQQLAEKLGQPVVIDNRPGGGGTIAGEAARRASPDGHTLFVSTQDSQVLTPVLRKKPPYDALRDFTQISMLFTTPLYLFVHPSVPVRTAKEFIARVKASPGRFTYGSSGIGATQHMSAELFSMMTGASMLHVPYKGGAPAMADLLAGHIDFMFSVVPTAMPFIANGRVRAIALTSARRIESMPQVPTLDESGLKGFDFSGWIGMLGPAGLPRPIVMQLNAEGNKAIVGSLRRQLVDLGLGLAGGTPEQFAEFIRVDTLNVAKVVMAAKIEPQ